MAYNKTRQNLMAKVETALSRAAEKEGREPVLLPVGPHDLEPANIAYKPKKGGSCLTMDGRYITHFLNLEGGNYPLMVVDNLPVETLRCLFNFDHMEDVLERQQEDHADYEYQNFLFFQNKGFVAIINPVDRQMLRNYYTAEMAEDDAEEDEVMEANEALADVPSVLVKPIKLRYAASGRFTRETIRQLRKLVRGYIWTLPPKKRKDFYWLYNTNLTQKEIADIEGVSEAAISQRKSWFRDRLRDYFQALGLPVLSMEEELAESRKRQRQSAMFEAESRAIKELFFPDDQEERDV